MGRCKFMFEGNTETQVVSAISENYWNHRKNAKLVALVGMNGSIDWCCDPHLMLQPQRFLGLLDDKKGAGSKFLLALTKRAPIDSLMRRSTQMSIVTRFPHAPRQRRVGKT